MNIDFDKYMLIPGEQNVGRRIYIISLIIGYMLMFISIYPNSHFIGFLGSFVVGSFLATIAQIKIYYFNDLTLGIIYRILLISTMIYIGYNISFISVDIKSIFPFNILIISDNPSEFKFFYTIVPLTLIIFPFLGMILSFPFKILSYALGFMDDHFYIEKREVNYEDFNGPAIRIKEMYNYDKYNETELQALKDMALRDENYEEAQRITQYIERKFPE